MATRQVAAAVLFAAALGACSSSSPKLDTSNPDAAVRQVLDKMNALNSYHMAITFSPEGTNFTVQVDYDDGRYYEQIDDPTNGESTELISAGALFVRNCKHSLCDQWGRQDAFISTASAAATPVEKRYLAPTLGGLTTTFPETLAFTAVDLASDWHLLPGSSTILLGQVDLGKAIDENRRRVGVPNPSPDPSASPLLPSTVELTVSSSDVSLDRVRIDLPGDELDPYFVVNFSQLNSVSVQAPAEFTVVAH